MHAGKVTPLSVPAVICKINAKRNILGFVWIPWVTCQHRKLREKLIEHNKNRMTTREVSLFSREETFGLKLNNRITELKVRMNSENKKETERGNTDR